ncbi:MAG: hypothetical protein A2X52_19475 [Candidatus Rokubacteria bacterium GWC2_70_16]|nr:MAG: hypothetical protein A2X52_19475 [Candidatus Rokubacteria bacterium GWC2_70_16]OGL15297.1 MAG: hypothetical protein A3K12_00475 [Candidatus Rokubacteria bacterium RIFCSPLOWO2_12_FULL_71_19]
MVIYDGACGLCQRSVAWLRARAGRGQLEFLPCQAPERQARFPWIEERACLEAMQIVLPDGRVLSGAAAIPEILRRLRGWRRLAPVFRIPGVGVLAPSLYRWVARHRHRLSRLPGSSSG